MTKVWIVNSSADEQRFVTKDQGTAEEIANILNRNKDSSDTEYYTTTADVIENINQLSKFVYLDAEKEEGEMLIYFRIEDGGWFRTYTTKEQADTILASTPHFTEWWIGEEED